MGDKTGISWTESTWSPVTGCTRVSAGCGGPGDAGGCYAERLAATRLKNHQRYKGVAEMKDGKPRWTGLVRTHPDFLDQPLCWKRPRRIFVCSQSDLFHKDVSDEFIAAVFGVMAAAAQHTFQVLTKRAARLPEWFAWVGDDANRAMAAMRRYLIGGGTTCLRNLLDDGVRWPLPNVHLGVSCEDQATADERVPLLLQVPAAVHWVSAEPLLAAVDLRAVQMPDGDSLGEGLFSHGEGNGVAWVVTGGESGPGARPMDVAWAQSLADQCRAAGVGFFMKQDSGQKAGQQGRIPDDLWAYKESPGVRQ